MHDDRVVLENGSRGKDDGREGRRDPSVERHGVRHFGATVWTHCFGPDIPAGCGSQIEYEPGGGSLGTRRGRAHVLKPTATLQLGPIDYFSDPGFDASRIGCVFGHDLDVCAVSGDPAQAEVTEQCSVRLSDTHDERTAGGRCKADIASASQPLQLKSVSGQWHQEATDHDGKFS
jgi:hypothetical protein